MSAIVFGILMLAWGGPARAVADPFDILSSRVATAEELSAAKDSLEKRYPHGGAECIERLVGVWSASKWSRTEAMAWACQWADDDTAPIIYEAIRKALRSEDDDVRSRVGEFFGNGSLVLWGRVKDPEPIMELAFDGAACGGSIYFYPAPPDLMAKWLVKDLDRRTGHETGGGSAGMHVTEETLPVVFRFVTEKLSVTEREGFVRRLNEDGVQVALNTLVEWSYEPVLELLQQIQKMGLSADEFSPARMDKIRKAVAKLQWQDRPDELLKVAGTERECRPVLHYAVWRLLGLRCDPAKVREALARNRVPVQSGPLAGQDLAERLSRIISGSGEDAETIGLTHSFDPLVLNRAEYSEYRSECLQARETGTLPGNYSYRAILDRAASDH